MIADARATAVAWARELLSRPADQWMILDTETTGLDSRAQVVQIAAIDGAGNVLIDNQLIRPTVEISFEAEMVHGLSADALKDAIPFSGYYADLYQIMSSVRLIVIYNAEFDIRILNQSFQACPIPEPRQGFINDEFTIECAMLQYATYKGEWNRRFRNFKWQRLPGGDHTALGDCRAVLSLIKTMAESE